MSRDVSCWKRFSISPNSFCLRPKLQHFANEATPSHPTHGSHYAKPTETRWNRGECKYLIANKINSSSYIEAAYINASRRQIENTPIRIKILQRYNSVHETSGEKWRHRGTETTAINSNSFTTFFLIFITPLLRLSFFFSRTSGASFFILAISPIIPYRILRLLIAQNSCGEGRLR